MWATLRLLVAFWLGLAFAGAAGAHFSPYSTVSLDLRRDHVDAELLVPAGELAYALGRSVPSRGYVLGHFGLAADDGRTWVAILVGADRVADGWGSDFRLRLRLAPPAGADPARFRLRDDALTERSPSHSILVYVRSDFRGGVLAAKPQLVGALRQGRTMLVIDRRGGGRSRGFLSAFALGVRHFLEGRDHQLFLLALMLPAPLLAQSGRWRIFVGTRSSCRKLAWLITAFTLGHSLTLAAAGLLGWSLSVAIVEPLVAFSVLIAALHALRPLFPGREALVAGGFGLVHGLAFAGVIASFSLDPSDMLTCILGFNLGIEAVQLGFAAAALLPWLWLARTRAYQPFRRSGAALIAAAALIWLAERLATPGIGFPRPRPAARPGPGRGHLPRFGCGGQRRTPSVAERKRRD